MPETPYIVYLYQDTDQSKPQDEWDTIFEIKMAGRGYDDYDKTQMVTCELCSSHHDDDYALKVTSPDGRRLFYDLDEGVLPHEWQPADYIKYYVDMMRDRVTLVEIEQTPPEFEAFEGVMELTKRGREEWETMNATQRKEIAQAELDEYNCWLNGDIYVVDVLKRHDECEECGHEPEPEQVDVCGGVYDLNDGVHTHIRDTLAHELKLKSEEVIEGVHYETEHKYNY